jgi:hypothetical protein
MLFETFYIFEILGLSLTHAQPRPPARLPNVDIDEIENKGKLLKNEKSYFMFFFNTIFKQIALL